MSSTFDDDDIKEEPYIQDPPRKKKKKKEVAPKKTCDLGDLCDEVRSSRKSFFLSGSDLPEDISQLIREN